ncbi:MAG: hypothetical protein ABL907_14370 [Hyphomicrobium sp.]
MMMSQVSEPKLKLAIFRPALAAMRYRVVVDEQLPAARIKIIYDGNVVADELVAKNEDWMVRFLTRNGVDRVQFVLTDLLGNKVEHKSRIRVSILQCIPISETVMKDA